MREINLRKGKYFPLVLLLVGILVGSVAAFTITTLTPLKVSMWKQGIEDSDFTVSSISVKPKRASVKVDLTLTNSGLDTHSAKVTVMLYDAGNSVLVESSLETGNVNAGDSKDLSFNIVVDVSLFNDLDILVEQLT